MTFVNQIAEIVHGVVDECWGAVNKNDGGRFNPELSVLSDITAQSLELRAEGVVKQSQGAGFRASRVSIVFKSMGERW